MMDNNKEPEVMRILHEIREKQHEETKDLPNEEWVRRIKDKADAFKKKHGLKLRQKVIIRK